VRTPSATMRMPARMSSSCAAASQLNADVAISAQRARARQHEIAKPAQVRPAIRAVRPSRTPARRLRQAARDQRRHGVMTEMHRLGHTRARIAMMFLSAAPISTPTTSSEP
jgi:hypothetical protein